ncbi:MAG: class I SAM-dependent methyltransferase [Candidatus Curtissbacteria bacterium]|nr:class I SAM-dependent methyltransferase [Candidatus Curtissbacteria bacterium]
MNTVEYLEKKFGPHKDNPHRLEGFLREDMYRLFSELGFTTGVEVGTEKGKNAQTMFEIIPNLKLYGVDAYKHHPQASHMYHAKLRNWDDKWFQDCKNQCLKRMNGKNFTLLQGFSENMADKMEDNSVDFVYIDSDHSYDSVMQDIIKWGRKVRKGGIMSGHDYFFDNDKSGRRVKVTQAINDYTSVHGIRFYITDEKHYEAKGDIYPSWFWVKLEEIWPNVIGS